jgi:translocator protein
MRQRLQTLPIVIIALAVVAISLLGNLATDAQSAWYQNLSKPDWNPPSWVFAPVWTTIYVLLIIAASTVWHNTQGAERSSMMKLFALNGIFNAAWSFCFFQAQSPLLGMIDILAVWVTILLLVIRSWRISKPSSMMLLPYLLWVTFASALNAAILARN